MLIAISLFCCLFDSLLGSFPPETWVFSLAVIDYEKILMNLFVEFLKIK